MKLFTAKAANSMLSIGDEEYPDSPSITYAHGMTFGRPDGITDEEYEILKELLLGYADVIEGRYDEE